MALVAKSERERQTEVQISVLAGLFEHRGIRVRREKLSRGQAFRVKSGQCMVSGERFVFVDRRLPHEQQVALLVDYLVDFGFELSQEEEARLSPKTQSLFRARCRQAA